MGDKKLSFHSPFILWSKRCALMGGFQIWFKNSNRITFGPFFGKKETVENWTRTGTWNSADASVFFFGRLCFSARRLHTPAQQQWLPLALRIQYAVFERSLHAGWKVLICFRMAVGGGDVVESIGADAPRRPDSCDRGLEMDCRASIVSAASRCVGRQTESYTFVREWNWYWANYLAF